MYARTVTTRILGALASITNGLVTHLIYLPLPVGILIEELLVSGMFVFTGVPHAGPRTATLRRKKSESATKPNHFT